MINKNKLIDRFFTYVKIDTQSNPDSPETPSTSKQWDLARLLTKQLQELGLNNVSLDDNGYVMADLDSNVKHNVPAIGFIAHYDTTPDFSGSQVKPQRIDDYDGKDIVLNVEKTLFCALLNLRNF